MVASWIVYCLVISGALALAAFATERVLTRFDKPVRGVWVVAIVGSIVLPAVAFVAPSFVRAASPVMSADTPLIVLPALAVGAPAAVAQGAPSLGAVLLIGWPRVLNPTGAALAVAIAVVVAGFAAWQLLGTRRLIAEA